jgi:hypothetical protein
MESSDTGHPHIATARANRFAGYEPNVPAAAKAVPGHKVTS